MLPFSRVPSVRQRWRELDREVFDATVFLAVGVTKIVEAVVGWLPLSETVLWTLYVVLIGVVHLYGPMVVDGEEEE